MNKTITKVQWREIGAHGKPKASLYNARLGIMGMKISARHDMFRDITIIGYLGDDVTHEITPLLGELPEGQQRRDHTMTLATSMKRNGWLRRADKKVTLDGQRHKGFYRDVARPLRPLQQAKIEEF